MILDQQRVIGVRDPHGFRPLVLGRLPARVRPGGPDDGLFDADDGRAGWCLSSETASLDIVGARFVRDVEPGEIVILEPGAPPRSVRFAEANPKLCVFELIYFARPDSYMEGRNLYEVRRRMGEQLAMEHPVEADLVMPVPDTGAPAAAGFAEASGLPYREGMYRNRYAGRTFIQPSQGLRHRGVTIKLNPLREVVPASGSSSSTTRSCAARRPSASSSCCARPARREVHVRISAPPIYHPCFYGIDTSIETELIASTHTGARDPRVHRRRFARLPVDPGRARRRSTCPTTGSASPASTATTRSPSRTTRRAASSCSRSRCRCVRAAIVAVADADARPPTAAPGSTSRRASGRSTSCAAHVESTRRPEVVGGLGGFGGGVRHPGRLPRAAARRLDRRGRHEDGHRGRASGASTRSASTSSRCAPTTSCAPAPSRSRSSTTWPSAGSTRSGSRSSSAASRPAAARPAPRSSAARRPSTRASWRPTSSTWPAAASASSSARVHRWLARSGPGTRSSGSPSSGLHANGYSLVRALVAAVGPRPRRAVPGAPAADARRCRPTDEALAAAPHETMATLGEVLLTPTRIYARPCSLRAALRAAGTTSTASPTSPAAACPGTCPGPCRTASARAWTRRRWPMPSVMRLFGALGGLDDAELRATFNGGLGMIAVVPAADVAAAIAALAEHGHRRAARRRGRRRAAADGAALRRGAARSPSA